MAVGAMTIMSSVMQFTLLPLQGLTQGAQPIISFNFGGKNVARVKKAFFLLLVSSLIYSAVSWGAVMLAPGVFVGIFTADRELAEIAKWAIRIYMAAVVVFGIQLPCQQTFVALGRAKETIFLALLRKVILLIPLIYILPELFADKTMAVFLAEPVADVLAVATTAVLFAVKFRQILKGMEKREQL